MNLIVTWSPTGIPYLSLVIKLIVCMEPIISVVWIWPREFLTMPFGLMNAPSVYQRAIDNALGELRNSLAIVYINDILIPSKSISEGLEYLEIVVDKLVNAGFSLNMRK